MEEQDQQLRDQQLALNEIREEAIESLFFFAKFVLGFSKLNTKIHGPICKILEDELLRRRCKIILPRSWYKSTLVSIAYPLWRATRNPNVRILIAQNTVTNAIAKLSVISNIVTGNELYRGLFPEILPGKKQIWKSDKLELNRTESWPEATFEAAGIRTQVVSRHYDLVIEDDTVAPDLSDIGEENLAPTKDDIDQAIGWHRLVPPLLTSLQQGEIIVVGTRWFEKDLLSWIGDHETQYTTYTRAVKESSLGIPDEQGELSFPEQFPQNVLDELEAAMGPYMYSCLYMNKPVRTGSMLFELDWFKYYDELPSTHVCYTSVDPAGDPEDTKGEPDFNVVATCAKDLVTGRVYLVDYFRAKCSPGDLIDAFFRHVELYRPVKAVVEAVAYQKSLLYHFRERMQATKKFVMVEPLTWGKKSKNARILGLQPLIKSGDFRLKQRHREFVSEALSFPVGKNDDVIDCVSMQLGLWAVTKTKRELKRNETLDPYSLEAAKADIRANYRAENKLPSALRALERKHITLPNGMVVSSV